MVEEKNMSETCKAQFGIVKAFWITWGQTKSKYLKPKRPLCFCSLVEPYKGPIFLHIIIILNSTVEYIWSSSHPSTAMFHARILRALVEGVPCFHPGNSEQVTRLQVGETSKTSAINGCLRCMFVLHDVILCIKIVKCLILVLGTLKKLQ